MFVTKSDKFLKNMWNLWKKEPKIVSKLLGHVFGIFYMKFNDRKLYDILLTSNLVENS